MCLKCEILSPIQTNKQSTAQSTPANTCEMLSIDWRRHQKTQLLGFLLAPLVSSNVTARNMYVWLLLHLCVGVCVEMGVCIYLAISKLLCSIRAALRTPMQTTSSLRASASTHHHHHRRHRHQQLLLIWTSSKSAESQVLGQSISLAKVYVYLCIPEAQAMLGYRRWDLLYTHSDSPSKRENYQTELRFKAGNFSWFK